MNLKIDPLEKIIDAVKTSQAMVNHLQIGLTWTSCLVQIGAQQSLGFAMSPGEKTRVLQWPGTIAGQSVSTLSKKLYSWDNFEATVAMAACNAVINAPSNPLLREAQPVQSSTTGNTAVFDYFKPRLENKKVAVIGRYPNLDKVLEGVDYTVVERTPTDQDLPDTAAEFLLPQMDWVFITSTSIVNKTFLRLSQLAKNAVTVLMGPTTPWMPEFNKFGVDFIAGVSVENRELASRIASEGGGTRLFEGGVKYCVADVSGARCQDLKHSIANTVKKRDLLKQQMESWYARGERGRFPDYLQLDQVDRELSELDIAYKRLWDATRG